MLRDLRNEIEESFKMIGNDMTVRALQGTNEKVSEMENGLNKYNGMYTIECITYDMNLKYIYRQKDQI